MADLSTTLQGQLNREQYSAKQLQEKLRPHAITAIQKLVLLMESTNENVALGAAKIVLAKVLPDLKSVDFSGDVAIQLLNVIRTPMKQPLQGLQDLPIKDGEVLSKVEHVEHVEDVDHA